MNKVYEYVQENIINQLKEAIKNGTETPWQKPWVGIGRPKNYVTQKPYRGINLLLLPFAGEYITFKQIKNVQNKHPEVHLKKGSKSYMVVFWKFQDKDKADEDDVVIDEDESKNNYKPPVFRYYKIYHISDVEGLKLHDNIIQNINVSLHGEAENLIDEYSNAVCINKCLGSDRAYYSAAMDTINIPDIRQFKSEEEFYSTVFHEMIHSTGAKKRLGRFDENANQFQFGSESYSKEELVAEIGASMLMSQFSIATKASNKNSVAYLQSWLKAIENDVTLITFAAQQSEKAVDYINKICNKEHIIIA
ncbi:MULTISPECIES: ArdC family protein [Clostridium]|uniref:ArdC family protein n=1 Tax=Clostridium TaxID=1485 RepID=UPI0008249BC1|nr:MULTISPECIES: zincin-like metallopeptidase domain-containing protein [Clostridium]PJI10245.1 DUF1738 domain-containing protein [Clostridium sp. CT7]